MGVDLKISRGSMPQTLLEARALAARDTCLVCSESLATVLILEIVLTALGSPIVLTFGNSVASYINNKPSMGSVVPSIV